MTARRLSLPIASRSGSSPDSAPSRSSCVGFPAATVQAYRGGPRAIHPGNRCQLTTGRPCLAIDAVVVEPEDLDHVLDVALRLDSPRGEPGLAGKDGVEVDLAAIVEVVEESLGEAEVGGVVAVEVTDLALADPQRELTPAARCRLDTGPRRDLGDDPVARTRISAHLVALSLRVGDVPASYKLK